MKKSWKDKQTIIGLAVFILIVIIFASGKVFSNIINAFSQSFGTAWGFALGILFILIILGAFLEKIIGK